MDKLEMNEEELRCKAKAKGLQDHLNKVFGFRHEKTAKYFDVEVRPALYRTNGVTAIAHLFFISDGMLCKQLYMGLGEEDFTKTWLPDSIITDISEIINRKPVA